MARKGKKKPYSHTATAEGHGGLFATTHWSLVLAAGDLASPKASAALETLCRSYWYPLYAYLRRSGHQPQDAEDVVQGFFVHLLRLRLLHSFFYGLPARTSPLSAFTCAGGVPLPCDGEK